jgi:hypothetical protein
VRSEDEPKDEVGDDEGECSELVRTGSEVGKYMGMGASEVRLMIGNAPEDLERAVVVGSDGELGRSRILPTSRSECEGCTVMPWGGAGI